MSNTPSADCGEWEVSMLTAGFLLRPSHQILVQGTARLARNVVVGAQPACLTKIGPDAPLVSFAKSCAVDRSDGFAVARQGLYPFKSPMKAVVAEHGFPL